jgi:hypothetical protein
MISSSNRHIQPLLHSLQTFPILVAVSPLNHCRGGCLWRYARTGTFSPSVCFSKRNAHFGGTSSLELAGLPQKMHGLLM